MQVEDILSKTQRTLCDEHMLPVIVTESMDILQLLMERKIYDVGCYKATCIIILNLVNFLRIVHDE